MSVHDFRVRQHSAERMNLGQHVLATYDENIDESDPPPKKKEKKKEKEKQTNQKQTKQNKNHTFKNKLKQNKIKTSRKLKQKNILFKSNCFSLPQVHTFNVLNI